MIKGIKYALNSSIGTKSFRPLDKIIDEAITLVPSEANTLISWGDFTTTSYTEKRFRLNAVVDGGCFVSVFFREEYYPKLKIYINGELAFESFSLDSNKPVVFYFQKGDIIDFVFSSDGYAYMSNVRVMGEFKKRNGLVEVRQ